VHASTLATPKSFGKITSAREIRIPLRVIAEYHANVNQPANIRKENVKALKKIYICTRFYRKERAYMI